MALNPAQVTCTFCGESNPLPAGAAGGQKDLEFDVKPPSTSTTPMKPLHDSSPASNTTVAAAAQERDPICSFCGKDNSKIPLARFCFSCGATLLTRQVAAVATPPVPLVCPHCGKEVSPQLKKAKFCLFCGKSLILPLENAAPLPRLDEADNTEVDHAIEPLQQPPPLHAEQAVVSTRAKLPGPEAAPATTTRPAPATYVRPAPAARLPTKPATPPIDMLNIAGQYEAPVLSAAFSKDGAEFYVGTARNEFIVRETTNARGRRIIFGDRTGKSITVLAGSNGGGFATCMNGTVMRFTRVSIQDPADMGFKCQIQTSQPSILSLAVNRSRSLLLLGGYDKIVEIWDLKAGKMVFALAGHAGAIDAVTFDPTGNLAATGSREGAVKVWKTENGDLVRDLFGHTKPVLSLAFSPDCTRLASGSEDGSIKIWDPEKNSAVSTLTGHRGGVFALAFNNDGKKLVSGGQDTVARVWDVELAKEIRAIEQHSGAINAVAISPDGKRVITGGADKRTYHWSLETEKKKE